MHRGLGIPQNSNHLKSTYTMCIQTLEVILGVCVYILKLKRAELFLHGIKQQDKTKARLYHAMLEYYDANHKKERYMRILK